MKWQGLVLLSTYVYLILQGYAAPLECNYADIVRNHLRLQTGQGSQTRNSRLWDAFKVKYVIVSQSNDNCLQI